MLEMERVVEDLLLKYIVRGWLISAKKGTWVYQQAGMIECVAIVAHYASCT